MTPLRPLSQVLLDMTESASGVLACLLLTTLAQGLNLRGASNPATLPIAALLAPGTTAASVQQLATLVQVCCQPFSG